MPAVSRPASARSATVLLMLALATVSAAATAPPVTHKLSSLVPDSQLLAAARGEVQLPDGQALLKMPPRPAAQPLAVCGQDTSRHSSVANVCKMYFKAANGRNYVCSGWLIAQNKVATAGHCVISSDGWITSAIFVCGGVEKYATVLTTNWDYYNAAFVNEGSGVHWSDAGVVRVDSAFPSTLRPYRYGVGSTCFGSRWANVAGYPADSTTGLCHYNGVQQWSSRGAMACAVDSDGFLQADFDSCGGGSGSRVVAAVAGAWNRAIGIFVADYTYVATGACAHNAVTRILDGGGSGLGVYMQPLVAALD